MLAPGNVFSLSQSASSFLRFNVSQSLDNRVFDFLKANIRWHGKPTTKTPDGAVPLN